MEVKRCHDSSNGFGIMQSYDTLYCQDEEAQRAADIYDNVTETQHFRKGKGEPTSFQLLEQVKNEPLEDDFHVKNYPQISNPSGYQVKKEELENHLQDDYPVYQVFLDVQQNTMEQQHPFKCPDCHKSFLQKTKLQRHIKTHSGERPHTCSYCQAAFSRSEHLQRHIRKHTGERPYSCTICQSAFTRKEHLQRHTRTHTGERPYHCSRCQETFLKKEHLQRHFRIHTGERPYQCDQCQQSFARNEHLQRHVETHKRGE